MEFLGAVLEYKLAVVAVALCLALVGCSADAGPNDPVMSTKDLKALESKTSQGAPKASGDFKVNNGTAPAPQGKGH